MKKFRILTCALCLILCCGCMDKRELEDQTFVVMMGIDKADDQNVTVTVAFPLTQTGGGEQGGAQGGGGYSVMSVKSPTMVEALNMFSMKLAGPLSLFSAKTIVISRELAEDDMLRHVLSSWRYEQLRNNTNILISQCSAEDFIDARMKNPMIDPLRQEDLILEQSNYSSYYKPIQFLDLIISMKSNGTDAAAMYGGVDPEYTEEGSGGGEKGGDGGQAEAKDGGEADIAEPVKPGYLPGEPPFSAENASQICGLAVFRDNRMVGVLDSSEAQTYAMMTKSKTHKLFTLPDPLDPDSYIVISIMPTGKGKIRSHLTEDAPVFDIDVKLHCTVECIQSGTDYTSDQNYEILTEYIRWTCAQKMQDLVTKLQKEYDADLLRLGDKLAYNFLTVRDWESYDWPRRYQDAEIRINVSLDIDRTGILKP